MKFTLKDSFAKSIDTFTLTDAIHFALITYIHNNEINDKQKAFVNAVGSALLDAELHNDYILLKKIEVLMHERDSCRYNVSFHKIDELSHEDPKALDEVMDKNYLLLNYLLLNELRAQLLECNKKYDVIKNLQDLTRKFYLHVQHKGERLTLTTDVEVYKNDASNLERDIVDLSNKIKNKSFEILLCNIYTAIRSCTQYNKENRFDKQKEIHKRKHWFKRLLEYIKSFFSGGENIVCKEANRFITIETKETLDGMNPKNIVFKAIDRPGNGKSHKDFIESKYANQHLEKKLYRRRVCINGELEIIPYNKEELLKNRTEFLYEKVENGFNESCLATYEREIKPKMIKLNESYKDKNERDYIKNAINNDYYADINEPIWSEMIKILSPDQYYKIRKIDNAHIAIKGKQEKIDALSIKLRSTIMSLGNNTNAINKKSFIKTFAIAFLLGIADRTNACNIMLEDKKAFNIDYGRLEDVTHKEKINRFNDAISNGKIQDAKEIFIENLYEELEIKCTTNRDLNEFRENKERGFFYKKNAEFKESLNEKKIIATIKNIFEEITDKEFIEIFNEIIKDRSKLNQVEKIWTKYWKDSGCKQVDETGAPFRYNVSEALNQTSEAFRLYESHHVSEDQVSGTLTCNSINGIGEEVGQVA